MQRRCVLTSREGLWEGPLVVSRVGWWQPCLRLGVSVESADGEPRLAPCGWRCPHRRPTVMGSVGNLVLQSGPTLCVEYLGKSASAHPLVSVIQGL
jgi:hypothetical protein